MSTPTQQPPAGPASTEPTGPGWTPMGTPSGPPAVPGDSGPERFRPAPVTERTSVGYRIMCALGLLLLVVGVPALLYAVAGPPPIPTRLPTEQDFTQAIGMEQVLTILIAIVWLAWLQFVLCTAVEFLAAARHSGLPRHLPLSGPSQGLARMLVGGLLLSGVIGGQVASVVASASATPERTTGTVATSVAGTIEHAMSSITIQTPDGLTAGSVVGANAAGHGAAQLARDGIAAAAEQVAAGRAVAGESTQLATADTASLVGKKVYQVEPPVGRHHDSLWEIAERHLGDGRRYKEIYELNKDRLQPDGRALHLARLIQPGWELVMPDDAVGVARVVTTTPAAPAAAQTAAELVAGLSGADAAVGHAGLDADGAVAAVSGASTAAGLGVSATREQSDPAAAAQAVGADSPASPLVAGLASSGIVAACLMIALLRQRRVNGGRRAAEAALDTEVALRVTATADRVARLDEALRSLAQQCAAARIPLPQVLTVAVDDGRIRLQLAPASTTAPDPWNVQDEGRMWVLDRAHEGRAPAEGPAPFPALVCIGQDEHGADVFVDLEMASGLVQIDGDPAVAAEVAAAIAVQLATAPWAQDVSVSAFGLSPELAAISRGQLEAVTDLTPVTARMEQAAALAGDDVLTGRMGRAGARTEVLVSTAPMDSSVAGRLAAVTSGGRHPFAVVAVGDVPGAQWRLRVDSTGRLEIGLLSLAVSASRLADAAQSGAIELFTAASDGTAREPAAGAGPLTLIPPPARLVDDAAFTTATARLGLLGHLQVRADGPIDPNRVPIAQEIVAFLATHPDGIHPSVLASAIWPRGVTHQVASATVDRVRDWLGSDPDGSARLRTDEHGRYVLAGSVVTDWDAFCALVDRARAGADPRTEAELLRRALRLVRGSAFEDHPVNRYAWLVRMDLERTIGAGVVAVSQRLAELLRASPQNDPEGAAASIEMGLRAMPTSQLLWRDLLEIQHDLTGAPGVREVVERLHETLDPIGIALAAETEAMIDHLLGGSPTAPSGSVSA